MSGLLLSGEIKTALGGCFGVVEGTILYISEKLLRQY
ncbi:Uncharacterised protein [Acinetobacter baumannii]|nr:Uncharacterised protein [Acinetobacter baumannii]